MKEGEAFVFIFRTIKTFFFLKEGLIFCFLFKGKRSGIQNHAIL